MINRSVSLKIISSIVLMIFTIIEECCLQSDSEFTSKGNTANNSDSQTVVKIEEGIDDSKQYNVFNKTSNENNGYGIDVGAKLIVALGFSLILNIVACVTMIFYSRKRLLITRNRTTKNECTDRMIQLSKRVTIEDNLLTDMEKMQLLMPIVRIVNMEKENRTLVMDQTHQYNYDLPLDERWEFPRDYLSLKNILGEGAFGQVVLGEAKGILGDNEEVTTVAVKMLKSAHSDSDMMDLVSEMEILKAIGKHMNIITLLGCCTQNGPFYVLVEYAQHGDLRNFLRKHRPLTKANETFSQNDLIYFAFQVCRGMDYLASKRCIHRDLAARNVLVSKNYVMKIADFGLARDIHEQDYYRNITRGRIPVKWVAPEALLHKVYTSQSDVWSYGVLLWEIMTFGGTPYPCVPIEQLSRLILEGYRMEKPPSCPNDIYSIMLSCWKHCPQERPMFNELAVRLEILLSMMIYEDCDVFGLPKLDTPPSSQDSGSY